MKQITSRWWDLTIGGNQDNLHPPLMFFNFMCLALIHLSKGLLIVSSKLQLMFVPFNAIILQTDCHSENQHIFETTNYSINQ